LDATPRILRQTSPWEIHRSTATSRRGTDVATVFFAILGFGVELDGSTLFVQETAPGQTAAHVSRFIRLPAGRDPSGRELQ
jgi:hypothetical protein